MKKRSTIHKEISGLVNSQLLAVLSTHRQGQPYANLVAFAVTEDLAAIFFATPRSTRKFINILQDNRVALLIDTRSNQSSDFHAAAAVTVLGSADEPEETEKEGARKLYLARHPYLEEFIDSPTTALLKVTVSRYIMVSRFQEVFELPMQD